MAIQFLAIEPKGGTKAWVHVAADTFDDLATIESKGVSPVLGSIADVAENGKRYMQSTEGEWKEQAGTGGTRIFDATAFSEMTEAGFVEIGGDLSPIAETEE